MKITCMIIIFHSCRLVLVVSVPVVTTAVAMDLLILQNYSKQLFDFVNSCAQPM